MILFLFQFSFFYLTIKLLILKNKYYCFFDILKLLFILQNLFRYKLTLFLVNPIQIDTILIKKEDLLSDEAVEDIIKIC